MKLNFILPVMAAFLVTACAVTPEPSPQKVYIIPGTAVGDPCNSERMYLDTPRGFPRICLNRKWVPICESANLTEMGREVCADYSRARAVPSLQ